MEQLDPVGSIADQVLETLGHAHSQSVIHRDIKPDNILVDAQGESMLLDFGVARMKDRARSGTSAYDLLGTVDYAAQSKPQGIVDELDRGLTFTASALCCLN